jgi:hypothetical protein
MSITSEHTKIEMMQHISLILLKKGKTPSNLELRINGV